MATSRSTTSIPELRRKNCRCRKRRRCPRTSDHYKSTRSSPRGSGIFEPRHSTKGFRYIRVEGHPRQLTADDAKAVVVHTDLRRTGWFECSDDRINRLHEAAVWTLRGNVVDIPTDCPHRERSGWTSEWLNFVRSAAFLYDVAGFSIKWLRDLAADQKPDGTAFSHRAGRRLRQVRGRGSRWFRRVQRRGSGRAVANLPSLRRCPASERAVVLDDKVGRPLRPHRGHRAPSRSCQGTAGSTATRAISPRHRRALWRMACASITGGPMESRARAGRDDGDFATAFLCYSATLLARMARLLGKH